MTKGAVGTAALPWALSPSTPMRRPPRENTALGVKPGPSMLALSTGKGVASRRLRRPIMSP